MQTLIQGLLHDTLSDPRVRRGFGARTGDGAAYLATTGGGAPAETLTRRDEATADRPLRRSRRSRPTIGAAPRAEWAGPRRATRMERETAGSGVRWVRRRTTSRFRMNFRTYRTKIRRARFRPRCRPWWVVRSPRCRPRRTAAGDRRRRRWREPSAGVGFGSAAGWATGDETGMPSDVDPAEIARARRPTRSSARLRSGPWRRRCSTS